MEFFLEFKEYAAAIIGAIFFTSLLLIRWYFYKQFKTDRIKKGDTITNLSKNTKSTVTLAASAGELLAKNVVCLPSRYSSREMAFIEEWFSEEGINQLKSANGRECYILKNKPPFPRCTYVDVRNIPVNFTVRSTTTLELEAKQAPRTVKLLLLNEWIK